jgi:hypothetical protein
MQGKFTKKRPNPVFVWFFGHRGELTAHRRPPAVALSRRYWIAPEEMESLLFSYPEGNLKKRVDRVIQKGENRRMMANSLSMAAVSALLCII